MSTATEIRKRLKEELGYNSRQVSVRSERCTYSWSFTFTIRDESVCYQKVEDFARKLSSISRCEASGEILSGGNTYTDVHIAAPVCKEWARKWNFLLEGIKGNISEKNGQRIGRFTFYLDQRGDIQIHDSEQGLFLKHTYRGTGGLAVDLFILEQTEPVLA